MSDRDIMSDSTKELLTGTDEAVGVLAEMLGESPEAWRGASTLAHVLRMGANVVAEYGDMKGINKAQRMQMTCLLTMATLQSTHDHPLYNPTTGEEQ